MNRRISGRQIVDWLGPPDRVLILSSAGLGLVAEIARQGWSAALPCAGLSGVAAAIAVIDLRHHRIPDLLSLPLIPLGLIYCALSDPLWLRLVAMAVVWVALKLLQYGFLRLRGKAGLGGGDVKLMTAAAAWLPFESLPFYILAASVTGLIGALLWRTSDEPIAFGAHLAPLLAILVLFS